MSLVVKLDTKVKEESRRGGIKETLEKPSDFELES